MNQGTCGEFPGTKIRHPAETGDYGCSGFLSGMESILSRTCQKKERPAAERIGLDLSSSHELEDGHDIISTGRLICFKMVGQFSRGCSCVSCGSRRLSRGLLAVTDRFVRRSQEC